MDSFGGGSGDDGEFFISGLLGAIVDGDDIFWKKNTGFNA